MEVGHQLQIQCKKCGEPINFSVLDTKQFSGKLTCASCEQCYQFDDKTLVRQLHQFESLCRQIHASEEILGSTSIALDLSDKHIKIPFNLLLTRLTSVLNLKIGDEALEITFRTEPTRDFVPQS